MWEGDEMEARVGGSKVKCWLESDSGYGADPENGRSASASEVTAPAEKLSKRALFC